MTEMPALPHSKAMRSPGGWTGWRNPWLLIFVAFALVPIAARFGAEGYILSFFIRLMVIALAALSLDLILGYGAMVSFGHAAFLGIGAYAVGILSSYGVSDIFLQIAAAWLAAIVFGAVTGAISLRTSGAYYIMITLAFGQMLYFFFVSLSAFGGDDGMSLSGRSTLFGMPLLRDTRVFFYVVLACLLAAYLGGRSLVGSRFGRVLRGTRENPVRMRAMGFEPFRYQLTAYVISGLVCALAGVLFANQSSFVSPAYMSWQRSGELLVMVILGGIGSLHGAILGAAAYLLLEEWLGEMTEHWKIVFGLILLLVVLAGRGGIVSLVTRRGARDA